MAAIVRIDDEVITTDDFLRVLKLGGQFEGLLEQLVRDCLAVRAARQQQLPVSADEVQQRADEFRRALGLHRAADTNRYLDALGVTLDEFEAFITDRLYQEKMMEQVCAPDRVQQYFKLNSPRFDSVEVSHMVLDSEGKAREMMSVLADEPGAFAEMARAHSVADTGARGGLIGKVPRGALKGEIGARVFSAAAGELLGPFRASDQASFEIFRVDARHPATLDADTAAEVRRLLREEWLLARAQEHVIEACPAR
jgi:parvulin-like peptidyl-prolyl isomerase